MKHSVTRMVSIVVGLAVAGCQPEPVQEAAPTVESDLVWAINVGGEAYDGVEGTSFVAEESVTGGTVGSMDLVKGSQDPGLYQTYRTGDIRVAHALTNGFYDITFHFAEPDLKKGDERVFDAIDATLDDLLFQLHIGNAIH